MRIPRSFAVMFLLITLATPVVGQDAPYRAQVVMNNAPVRCQPSREGYVCIEMPRGEQVEVYERQGDWLAIRPPESTFSWVDAAATEPSAEEGIALIRIDGAPSWIGALDGVDEHHSAVQLQLDEKVRVLDRVPLDGDNVWLKISPPAGEFRWIHANHVHRRLRPDSAQIAPSRRDWASRDDEERGASVGDGFQQRLTRLQIQLSRQALEAPERWDLEALVEEAEKLLASGRSALQRGQAERVRSTIQEMSRVAERAIAIQGDQTRLEDEQVEAFAAHYQAVGWLMRVHSRRQNSPPYAVLDNDGKILQLVTPAPGVNLQRYVNDRVGILGESRSVRIAGGNRNHVTASRIVRLERADGNEPAVVADLPWIRRR